MYTFAEKDTLSTILKNAIATYHTQVENIMSRNNSSLERYRQELALLEEDSSNITEISLEELAEILADAPLSEEERETEFNYLKSVKGLLDLNKTKNTTFQLSSRQIAYVEELKKQIKVLEKEAQEMQKVKAEEASTITERIKELNQILGILEDPRSTKWIEDPEKLVALFQEMNIDESIQRSILYGLLRFNHNKYQDRLEKAHMPERERLNLEEVKELFKKYSYNFLELKENLQELILSYGTLKDMDEVFTALAENFPKFDMKKNGTKLCSILLNGNAHTIKDAKEYASKKGITPSNLLMMVPAIIDQAPRRKRGQLQEPSDRPTNPLWIPGRSEDFRKNIEFMEEIGFSIDHIFRKCKELLVMSNDRLIANYRAFIKYGFTLHEDEMGDLTHPALSCLLSSNFSEIVDKFIESGRLGHQYIKENMSRVTTISDPEDLVFYNIYASYLDQDEMGNPLNPIGPFVNENHRKLRLRGEITRYKGSGYDNTPYRGITETNKREKTMTIEIDCQNKKEFDEAVESAKGREGDLYNLVFNDERILDLEEFTDISNPTRYDFEGTLISKQKVSRILNILKNEGLDTLDDSLLYAVTYHSIMNQETLDKIKKILKGRRK